MTKAYLLQLMPARYDYRKKSDPYQEHKEMLSELVAEGKIIVVEKTFNKIIYEKAK